LPLLHRVRSLGHLLFEVSIVCLVFQQSFLFLFLGDEDLIGLVLVFLPIDGLEVSFFRVSFLKVKLSFKFYIADIGIHFDDIVPEGLFLVEGLLDFTDGQVGGIDDPFEGALEGFAYQFLVVAVGLLGTLEQLGLCLEEANSNDGYSLKLLIHSLYFLLRSARLPSI
jgi:hypothetical protein